MIIGLGLQEGLGFQIAMATAAMRARTAPK
jgi:hypothetical protein